MTENAGLRPYAYVLAVPDLARSAAYFHADDVDALHAKFVRRGAIVLQPPTNRPRGMREMAIATPDGHRIMIGRKIR